MQLPYPRGSLEYPSQNRNQKELDRALLVDTRVLGFSGERQCGKITLIRKLLTNYPNHKVVNLNSSTVHTAAEADTGRIYTLSQRTGAKIRTPTLVLVSGLFIESAYLMPSYF